LRAVSSLPPFVNEPILELRRRDARDALEAGKARLEPRLPLHAPALIGRERSDGDALVSTDPGNPDRAVALAPRCTPADAARGVCAVIAPWNFPVAIPCGMTAAALATGNTVVLKPAEQSPGCGAMVAEALRAGGVPPEAIGLVPGLGDVGAALVADPRVHTI